MKRKLALILSLVLVLSLVLAGCGEKDPAPADTDSEAKDEKVEDSVANPAKTRDGADTLIVGMHEVKGDFIPVYYSTEYDGYVVGVVYDGLLSNDEEGNPIPHVAKEWELSEDKKTYTFHLRDDVKFSDGEPLTAKDIEFTYMVLCDPTYDGRYTDQVSQIIGREEYSEGKADNIEGIKVIDDYTISFTFSEALATHIWDCSFAIMPKHAFPDYKRGNIEAIKAQMQTPVGSGPFILEKFEAKQFVEFKANPDYFLGAPKVDKMIFKFTTAETQMSEVEKGSIDVQLAVPPKSENKEIIDGTGFVNIVEYPDNGYGYMGWNLRDPRLADKRVRQALTYGFNRQQFVEVYYQGYATICNVPISQVSWAYTDDINDYAYDPDKAIALLEEAGWMPGADGIREKDGMKLDFVWDTYTDSKYVETMIPMLKADWEKIGVKVEPNLMEFNSLVEKVYDKREFDMYNMAWSLSIDPDALELFHTSQDIPSGNNSIGFRNEENDKLMEAGRKEFDQNKRAEIYHEWAKLMNEELPYMFLTQNLHWDAVNERVKNWNTSPYIDFSNPSVIIGVEIEQ
ncbi:ABC transporter substrate-binding protein [Anaerosalibacter sp. Marseille-P3206]|uniref:ABC transporter substrate-binding protein n=1 Tax=Anaerosalibacter sp. Marseille-P3206 TaxID=1871005 RepID=UPI00135669BD|nr:ABC transporter substrate-binding protein [Anaerosalibacter sp. Marseille-P3206]